MAVARCMMQKPHPPESVQLLCGNGVYVLKEIGKKRHAQHERRIYPYELSLTRKKPGAADMY